MEHQKIKIEPRFPVLILMFQKDSTHEKSESSGKMNREDTYNFSMVFEGLASLCFRKRKPCQNPDSVAEPTFFFGETCCQTPQKPCSLSTLQVINRNLNSKFNYNGKYSF